MLDFWGVVLLIVWMIDGLLTFLVRLWRLRFLFGLGEPPTTSAMEAAKRARLKILSPAAQRALAEAEQRRRDKLAANIRANRGNQAP